MLKLEWFQSGESCYLETLNKEPEDCVPRKSLSGVWLWSRGGDILSRLKIYRLTIPEERGEIAIRCAGQCRDIQQEPFLLGEIEGIYCEPWTHRTAGIC